MLHGFEGQSHGFVQEVVGITHSTWIETVPKKMSAFYETFGIFGKCIPHRRWSYNHYPHEKWDRSNSKAGTPNHSQRMQKFLWSS